MPKKPNAANSILAIEMWPIDKPIDYHRNARKWSKHAIAKVADSIRTYGWRQPLVVDAEGVIVIGHLRRAGGKEAGETQCPVHVARDLSPAKIKALRLADNRLHEESAWDLDLLGPEFLELKAMDFDLKLAGFDWKETHRLGSMGNMYGSNPTDKAAGALKLQEKWATESGQLWDLPSCSVPGTTHRLMIGNSLTDMAQLLGEVTPDGIVSDPNYGMVVEQVSACLDQCRANNAIMLMGDVQMVNMSKWWAFRMLLVFKHRTRLGFNKNLPLMTHVCCPVFTKEPGAKVGFKKPRPNFTSLQEDVPGGCYEGGGKADDYPMGQAKSAAVFEIMLSGFMAWRTVVDPFAGTGASLLACEMTERRWLGMEIDPATSACCLQRAANAGLSPVLVPNSEQNLEPVTESASPSLSL